MSETVVLGTRGSALARVQTDLVAGLLRERFPGLEVQVRVIETRGDAVQDRPISAIGDKGVFVRAIERALLEGEIDLAIHSLKDVPADDETPGLTLAAFSAREDPRDALVAPGVWGLSHLGPGARIGTSSARRRVQLARLLPSAQFLDVRGNVDTRLRKLDAGEYDALVLAAAGLKRLGLQDRITHFLDPLECVPDAGQGVLAVQARADSAAAELARAIDDRSTRVCVSAERAVVRGLEAGCHSPVGAYARMVDGVLQLAAVASAEDGSRLTQARVEGPASEAESLGLRTGRGLLARIQGGSGEATSEE